MGEGERMMFKFLKGLFKKKEPFINNYYEMLIQDINNIEATVLINETMQLSILQLSGTVEQTIYYNDIAQAIMQEVNKRMGI